MYSVDYSIIHKMIASIMVGFVIKLLDDYIDDDSKFIYNNSLIDRLGKGIVPYSMIIFSIGAGIDIEYSVTLMSACYMVGMFHDLYMKLPTGLRGYQESIILLFLNTYLFSFKIIITSLVVILLIQFIDDLVDMKWDKKYGYKNFANRFGKVEIIVTSIINIILLILLDVEKLFVIVCAYFVVSLIYKKVSSKEIN